MTSLVQAQGFDLATATKWTSELLVDFCDVANFDLGFVPDASLLKPPSSTTAATTARKPTPMASLISKPV